MSEALDRIFAALSDGTRRQIVHALADGDKSVSELAEPFDMSLAAVSKHIKVLEAAGVIERQIQGRTHSFTLLSESLTEALDWISVYRHFWLTRFNALEPEESVDDNTND